MMNEITNKLYAVGAAGALTTILVWAMHQWGKVDVPAEVASALTTVISVVTGYLTPRSQKETDKIVEEAVSTGVYKVPKE